LHQAAGEDLSGALKQVFGQEFPYLVEASGSPLALRAALGLAPQGGRILVLGDYEQARADFAWNFLLHREIELLGSNAGAGAWPEAVRLAVEGRLPLERLVTHRLPYTQFARGMELARSPHGQAIKIMLTWEEL
jgi:threonine dehydrogenase-like Zn-dependent dehydrogenase